MEIRPSRIEGFVEISCDTAHIIRRKGSDDTTENRITTVPSGTEDEWEEVVLAAVLAEKERREREEAYKADVVTRIRARYSSDDENAILRKMLAVTVLPMPTAEGAELEAVEQRTQQIMTEFDEYNTFAEECKAEARKARFAEDYIAACDSMAQEMLTEGGE